MWLWLFAVAAAVGGRPVSQDDLHCSRTISMEGEIKEYEDIHARTKILSSLQFILALHETACILIKSSNDTTTDVVHALEFNRLEQHHPVSGKYVFGIPKLSPTCICDCAGGSSKCKMEEYNYKNCSSGALCYRTYHPVQSSTGCQFGIHKSEVCCNVQIDPYKDWKFTALRVGQPDTVLVFRYVIRDRPNSKWRTISQEFIEIPMNKGNARFEFKNTHQLDISVTGSRPNREMLPGTYFVREGTKEVRSVAGLNDVTSVDLNKLGWFRFVDGKWIVPNGPVRMKEKFHVDVIDCHAHKYSSTFNGEQMVSVSQNDQQTTDSFDLGQDVASDPWIESATFDNRVVRVIHAEGVAVTVHMTTESKPTVLHHLNQFDDFSGFIRLNKLSNRYMNVTFYGAKGTIIGTLYNSERKEHVDMVLSISVDSSKLRDYTTIIALPSTVDKQRFVCFHPSGDEQGEQCKWMSFEAEQLNDVRMAHEWQSGQGVCPGCNEFGVDGVIAALNPKSWLDGIDSTKEALALAIEVVAVGGMLLMLICMCTKCFIPLAKCSLWVPRISSSKS